MHWVTVRLPAHPEQVKVLTATTEHYAEKNQNCDVAVGNCTTLKKWVELLRDNMASQALLSALALSYREFRAGHLLHS